MGEIKLSPIWGYVLNSLCQTDSWERRERREGGG